MIRTFASVRVLLILALLAGSVANGHARIQERKLLDRIMQPDGTLQNSAQGKQFVAGGEVLTKQVTTRRFLFFSRRPTEKQFAGVKQFDSKSYPTNTSRFAKQQADISTRTRLPNVDKPYATTAFVTRDAPDAHRIMQTSADPEVRPFLVRGKSQKSLDAQHHELTIDEVRELLNKNK